VNGPRIGTRHGGSCGALRPACPQHRAIPMNVIWLNALSQRQRAMSADLDATLAILTEKMPRLGPTQRRVVRRTIREIKRARWRLRIMGLKLWLSDTR
jgi:hypothetical protein